jgi:hypothetical protein
LRQVLWVTLHYKSSFHVWDRFYEWLFTISPHFMFETGFMSDSSLYVLISCLRQVLWVTFHYKSSCHVWDRFYEWLHYKSSFHVWDRFYEWHFIISPHFMFETGCMSDSSLKVVISCLRQVLWVTLHYKSSFHVWDRFYEWLFTISPHFMFETGFMSDSSL